VLEAATGKAALARRPRRANLVEHALVVEHQGVTQIIVNGTKKARAMTGDGQGPVEDGPMTTNAIPSPVAADGVAYVMSGYNGSVAIACPSTPAATWPRTTSAVEAHARHAVLSVAALWTASSISRSPTAIC